MKKYLTPNLKKTLSIGGCLAFFVVIVLLYVKPVLFGQGLYQSDIANYQGAAQQLRDFRGEHGQETYWTDSVFSGMPTYFLGARYQGDWLRYVDETLRFLPRPADYLFLLLSGFFLLGLVFTRKWKYALLGALFFGFSTYFFIIISVGHNAKVHAIAYFAPLLAGLVLLFREKYASGFLLSTLATGLLIYANHPQMAYYLGFALAFYLLCEGWFSFKENRLKSYFKGCLLGLFSFVLGLGMNAQRLFANFEILPLSNRGASSEIFSTTKHNGLDQEQILEWSYGKMETFNLLLPRWMGGGSNEPLQQDINAELSALLSENNASQQDYEQINAHLKSFTYWGEQIFTEGGAYQGFVVVFLALLGFFFLPKRHRSWMLSSSVLIIMLAWGKNWLFLSEFFIDYIPFYNKFRAVSSILVVVEFLFPLVAMLGLFFYFKEEPHRAKYKQKVVRYGFVGMGLFLSMVAILGQQFLAFSTGQERDYLPAYLLHYLQDLRFSLLREDALWALSYLGLIGVCFYLYDRKKNTPKYRIVGDRGFVFI